MDLMKRVIAHVIMAGRELCEIFIIVRYVESGWYLVPSHGSTCCSFSKDATKCVYIQKDEKTIEQAGVESALLIPDCIESIKRNGKSFCHTMKPLRIPLIIWLASLFISYLICNRINDLIYIFLS